MPGRMVPSAFDPANRDFEPYSLPFSYRWKTLTAWLSDRKPRVSMLRTPPFWQLEALAADACRTARVPIHFNDPGNMPLARAAIAAVPIDAVVTVAESAEAFLAHLRDHQSRIPRHWLLIHDHRATAWRAPAKARGVSFVSEVHAHPGVPLLYQCRHLAGTELFHRVPGAALSSEVHARRTCRCGKAVVGRL